MAGTAWWDRATDDTSFTEGLKSFLNKANKAPEATAIIQQANDNVEIALADLLTSNHTLPHPDIFTEHVWPRCRHVIATVRIQIQPL